MFTRSLAAATTLFCLTATAALAQVPAAAADATGGAAPTAAAVQQGQGRPLQNDAESQAIAHTASRVAAHTLRRGSHGRLVRQLQDLLRKAGLHVPLSGSFDARTQRAVRRFQRLNGLPVTGVSDNATAQALGSAAAASVASQVQDAGWVFPLTPVNRVESPRFWSQDQGVDLGGSSSDCGPRMEELAVASGTIVELGIGGFGSYAPIIKLDSGPDAGRYVYYGHAAPALVTVGEHVVAGQPVADVGCGIVGISSTPHLEIGISEPGGPPCCPGRGSTSGEVLSQLTFAYDYAKAHPHQNPVVTPPAAVAPPPGAAATPSGATAAP